MVLPGTCGLARSDHQAITPKLARDRICDVTAATAWAGHFIDAGHELVRKQQVRAHIHAHTIAHACVALRRSRRRARCAPDRLASVT